MAWWNAHPEKVNRKAYYKLVCKNCGELTDVFLEDFTPAIQRDAGVEILSYDLNIVYLCPKCKETCATESAVHNE